MSCCAPCDVFSRSSRLGSGEDDWRASAQRQADAFAEQQFGGGGIQLPPSGGYDSWGRFVGVPDYPTDELEARGFRLEDEPFGMRDRSFTQVVLDGKDRFFSNAGEVVGSAASSAIKGLVKNVPREAWLIGGGLVLLLLFRK